MISTVSRLHKLPLSAAILCALLVALLMAPLAVSAGGTVGGSPAYPREDNPRTPSIFIHELEPCEQATDGVEVSNTTDDTATVGLFAVDGRVASGGSFACAQNEEDRDRAGAWLELEQDEITLEPNQTEVVDFTITVPEDATPGENNACIAIQQIDDDPDITSGGIALRTRSAIRVALTVPGDLEKELAFTDVKLKAEQDQDEATISTSLRNNGNVSLDTDIEVDFRNLLWSRDVVGGTFPILAGSDTERNFSTENPFWGGFYQLNASATYVPDPQAGIGEEGDTETITETAWVFVRPQPLALAIEVAILVVLMSVSYYFIRPRRLRSKWQAAGETYTVSKGDHLHDIADDYDVNWRTLASVNRIKPPYRVKAKQKLIVPPNKQK